MQLSIVASSANIPNYTGEEYDTLVDALWSAPYGTLVIFDEPLDTKGAALSRARHVALHLQTIVEPEEGFGIKAAVRVDRDGKFLSGVGWKRIGTKEKTS